MTRNLWIILFSAVFICGLTGIIKAEWITTELTVYTPYECPNEHTASGTIPTEGRTIACNWLPFGTRVQIYGHWYTVEDWGGMEGIDIFKNSYDEAIEFGRRNAEVYIER